MAKKSRFNTTHAVKTAAGVALGAAAVAATGVVGAQVVGAIRKSKPLLPKRQRRAAATGKARSAKRKSTVAKTTRRPRTRR